MKNSQLHFRDQRGQTFVSFNYVSPPPPTPFNQPCRFSMPPSRTTSLHQHMETKEERQVSDWKEALQEETSAQTNHMCMK